MNKRINSIQILRGLAAILVVYAHSIDLAEWFHQSGRQAQFKFLGNFGAIGVDIFFVISGFIMVYVTKNKQGYKDAHHFFAKRLLRIYSLYFPLTILFIFYKRPDLHTIFKDITLLPVTDSGTVFVPLSIQVAWTLSFEIFFYLIMTVSILFSKGGHLLTVAVILLSLSLAGIFGHFSEVHITFMTNPILMEFLFGLIVGWLYINQIKVSGSLAIAIFLAAIVIYGFLIFYGYGNISEADFTLNARSSLKRILLWGIPSAMLVFGFVFFERTCRLPAFFNNKALSSLGNASYSVYLTHTILFSGIIFIHLLFWRRFSGDVLIIIFLVMAIVTGLVTHKFIEKKLLSFFTSISTK